jgi:hypothetical protein
MGQRVSERSMLKPLGGGLVNTTLICYVHLTRNQVI